MNKTRCAVYARVSTEEQAKGDSIQHQIEFFNEYVKKNNLIMTGEYIDEGVSGTKAESREAFLKLLRDAELGKFDIILTKSVSRLARNLKLAVNTIYDLIERNIRLITIEDNIDTVKPDARLLLGIHATLAEQESERISARVKFGKKQKAKKGYFIGSYPPYGYKRIDRNTIVPSQDETTRTVKRIFEMFLDGYGMRTIARILNEEGIAPPSAQRGMINSSRLWNDRSIKFILTNHIYAGTLVQHRSSTISSISGKRLKNDDAVIAKNAIEPVIDAEDFYRAQKKFECRGDMPKGSSTHLFSGILECGDCGSRMYYRSGGYVCSQYSRFGNLYCSSHYVAEKVLLDILQSDIRRFCQKVDVSSICSKVKADNVCIDGYRIGELKEVEKRLVLLRERMTHLLRCFSENLIEEYEFREQARIIAREREVTLSRQKKLEELLTKTGAHEKDTLIRVMMTQIIKTEGFSPLFVQSIINKIKIYRESKIAVEYNMQNPNDSIFDS